MFVLGLLFGLSILSLFLLSPILLSSSILQFSPILLLLSTMSGVVALIKDFWVYMGCKGHPRTSPCLRGRVHSDGQVRGQGRSGQKSVPCHCGGLSGVVEWSSILFPAEQAGEEQVECLLKRSCSEKQHLKSNIGASLVAQW